MVTVVVVVVVDMDSCTAPIFAFNFKSSALEEDRRPKRNEEMDEPRRIDVEYDIEFFELPVEVDVVLMLMLVLVLL